MGYLTPISTELPPVGKTILGLNCYGDFVQVALTSGGYWRNEYINESPGYIIAWMETPYFMGVK